MAYDLEQQEQFDAFKAWWAKYGTAIMAFIAVAVLAWGGWAAYKAYQNHRSNQAMGYFEALSDAAHTGGADSAARIKSASQTLRRDHPASAYTGRGVLIAAQALLKQHDVDGAYAQLEWLVTQPTHADLRPLARLRLAGILLDQKKYDQALAQLQSPPAPFVGLYADRRGDILVEQGKSEEAQQAWQQALADLGFDDPLKQAVQLKLDALSGV
jgi:predicted negative regulator of RcsB-dependent stress response